MKAVILAAGRGTRIQSASRGRPKCLLDIGGRTILDYQVEALWSAGVSQIGIVTGYQGHQIVEHIDQNFGDDMDAFHFMRNPAFATTNNIYSLWMAREWVGSDAFVCLNADVLCHPEILPQALKLYRPVNMIVDPEWRDETMKVIIQDGNVVRMSKAISHAEFNATYIGITVFSSRVVSALFSEIGSMLLDGRVNEFFNQAVQNLVDCGLRVGFSSTRGLPWAEIDDPADLRYARTCVCPNLPHNAGEAAPDRAPVLAVA